MRTRKLLSVCLIAALTALCLTACSGDKAPAVDVGGKTYYNTVELFGNEDHTRIWFGKDGSFVMDENSAEGRKEYSGTWSVKENVCTLNVTSGDGPSKIILQIEDADTLTLQTTLAGSKSGQKFSTNETKGPTDEKGNPSSEPVPTADPYKLGYGTYYNVSQNSVYTSYVEINKDGTFSFLDRNSASGGLEIQGTWKKDGNKLVLGDFTKYNGDPSLTEINFTIVDEKDLELNSTIQISKKGNSFTTDYTPPSAPPAIPCTSLSSPYTYLYAVEGTGTWSINDYFTVTPKNTTDKLVYQVDDESIVTCDQNGNVKAGKAGETKIRITCGSQQLVFRWETRKKGPEKINLTPASLTLQLNETGKLTAKIVPETANPNLTWASSNPSVATVDNDGFVKPKLPGNTKITVTGTNGVSSSCSVKVEGEKIVFNMQDKATVKSGSGQKIPVEAYHYVCWDSYYNKYDIRPELDFHCSDTSVLGYDGSSGNVYVKGSVSSTKDVTVYFTWSDGSSLSATSPTYTVRVEK